MQVEQDAVGPACGDLTNAFGQGHHMPHRNGARTGQPQTFLNQPRIELGILDEQQVDFSGVHGRAAMPATPP